MGSYVTFKDAASMGLQVGDDIDALALNAIPYLFSGSAMGNQAYFSLAPGSPTLLGADGLPGTADDLSAADIFYTDFTGGSALVYSADSLGLLFEDDLDALETNAVPEPVSMLLLAAGGIIFAVGRRRP